MTPLFDTNILIDWLKELPAARAEVALYSRGAISVVTWIEVLVGVVPQDRHEVTAWLATCTRIELDEPIMRRTVEVRRATKLKLPDAIIYASALERDHLLVTRDTRGLPEGTPGVRVPYAV